jgi:hypothetical protein
MRIERTGHDTVVDPAQGRLIDACFFRDLDKRQVFSFAE